MLHAAATVCGMKILLAVAFVLCSLSVSTFGVHPMTLQPGPIGFGVTLLPNGWKIAPAGHHIVVGDLPLAMAESPDRRWLLVSNNGYALPSISIVDVQHQNVRGTLQLDHAWVGLAWHPDGKRVYVSGAANNTVHELTWANGVLMRGTDIALGRPMDPPQPEDASENLNRPIRRRRASSAGSRFSQPTPALAPYAHVEPRIPLDERNDRWAWGADASSRMNMAEADLAPEREFNEIIWRSVKGPNSLMPPTVRRAWMRTRGGDDDDADGRKR